MVSEDAQMYTIEALAAAMIILFAVLFIVQAAPLTPLTTSAANEQVERQLAAYGKDLLTVLDYHTSYAEDSVLKTAILEWNGLEEEHDDGLPPAASSEKGVTFNNTLIQALTGRGIAYNLVIEYYDEGGLVSKKMVWNGKPSDNAVTVSRKIVIYDAVEDDYFTGDKYNATGYEYPATNTWLYDYDQKSTSGFRNLINVKLTLWWM
jgi:hypothetical protein